jgi:monothiol glutaredoxin
MLPPPRAECSIGVLSRKTELCYGSTVAVAPAEPPLDRENPAVVVFAIGPDFTDPKTVEMVGRCRRHGMDPAVLDATTDPWFSEPLLDPGARQHFPLLCVRGGLVGGIDVVRRLDSAGQLLPLLRPDPPQVSPTIALSRSAADELKRALQKPEQCIRIGITAEFEHDLGVDGMRPGDVKLMLGDVPVVLDAESASRANGLGIEWIETGEVRAFRVDNPNRPEAVRVVDRGWFEREGRTLNLLVVDVRTVAEHASGHLDQAKLLDATLIDALEQLDRRTPLLFYCNGGVRSRHAAEHYRKLGFSEVYCLRDSPLDAPG